MNRALTCIFTLTIINSFAQTPPCGNDYGSSTDESNIIYQMRYGTIAEAVNAINQAKNTRGTSLGCPQESLSYNLPDLTEPSLSTIETVWNTIHSPAISSYLVDCPRIGRYENNAALGAYYAIQAGYPFDQSKLVEIANMMYDQQYAPWNILAPEKRNEGVFGYVNVNSSDPCYPGGVVGSSVSALCTTLPDYCVTYTDGQFAGNNFAISGQDDTNNWFDGGLAYDHGWIGIQMIESAIGQSDPFLKRKFRNSVELAGHYAINEYSVKNHNYTAKLIWLLSELYAWTGDPAYKDELNYKINKNLIPGILWDGDNDGFVDGTSPPIAFNTLTATAQTPGRMWDGHNALPWYHSMNAWALTEAYVAFRDRGETIRANELKPYVVAMLDNLAEEIISQGVIAQDVLGVRDITYALLIGIWKVSQYENETHIKWEQAAWALWNSGFFNHYSTHSVCVGLYLIVKNATPFQPLHLREDFILSSDNPVKNEQTFEIYPNLTSDKLILNISDDNHKLKYYVISDIQGRIVSEGNLYASTEINISGLNKGLYLIRVSDYSKRIKSVKFIRN